MSQITIKQIFDPHQFFDFYFKHADLFHWSVEQEIEYEKDKPLTYYLVFDDQEVIIACFVTRDNNVGYFALVKIDQKILHQLISFWKSKIPSTIKLNISSRYLEVFVNNNFKLNYSRTRMTLKLDSYDFSNCFFEDNSKTLRMINIDDIEEVKAIAKTIFESYQGTLDQSVLDINELDLEKEAKLLSDIFHKTHPEFKLVHEGSFIYENSLSEVVGVILVTDLYNIPLIYDVVVLQSERGKKIALKLLCSAVRGLIATNHQEVMLYVTNGNTVAESLYTKLHFIPDEYFFCLVELNQEPH